MVPRKMIYLAWIGLLSILSMACRKAEPTEDMAIQKKWIKGISYESPSNSVGAEIYGPMRNVNANYVAIIPFGFVRPGNPTVYYDLNWQWWGERTEGVASLTEDAHAEGLQVMLKPQIWIGGGGFTGTYDPGEEADWQVFEQGYYDYILHYADLADSLGVALYCIGTEWKVFATSRPVFWERLIDSVRVHYKGALTYAGNWDGYTRFPHWQKLDYIGIDAYFPLSDEEVPTVEVLQSGWQETKQKIFSHQQALHKPVLFTEYGYRSVEYCTRTPWESGRGGRLNMEAQVNAYQALYETFWQEPWFAGGFLWKWHSPHTEAGGLTNDRFTPQNKPAEAIVKQWYAR